jgi:hypothetical protein
MNDDAEKKLAAHHALYAAQVEVESGYMFGTEFVALDDVLIWARAVAESQEHWLASRYGVEGSVEHGAQQDEHVRAWLNWCATQKQAAE